MKQEKYHKYVFDSGNRTFIGNFEEMYSNESSECFDSWHQDDSRHLARKISLAVLEGYNFDSIVDIGCGKGAFTHVMKKRNNRVFGVDIAPTALTIAAERYPDIDFHCLDIRDKRSLEEYFIEKVKNKADLILCSEVLSYIEKWPDMVELFSLNAHYFLTTLYIPEHPIGYVKSEDELMKAIKTYFTVREWISLRTARASIIFAESKKKRSTTHARL
ncbi:MAG: class I SAM-dependent methyltransferase [Candidatus Eremiobacteraeota bacterium]|nr:class I SAM-dependent methyltransferase [Candidatus Eremiobacteraeota bacterium]